MNNNIQLTAEAQRLIEVADSKAKKRAKPIYEPRRVVMAKCALPYRDSLYGRKHLRDIHLDTSQRHYRKGVLHGVPVLIEHRGTCFYGGHI